MTGPSPAGLSGGPSRRQVLGQAGEAAAAAWYEAQGYEVLGRNWRGRGGELDLILGRGREVVFCEVKTRTSDAYGIPAEAVTPAKQARIRRLSAQWLAAGSLRGRSVRFDVASVLGGAVEILEDVF